jgi:hypothetical protein
MIAPGLKSQPPNYLKCFSDRFVPLATSQGAAFGYRDLRPIVRDKQQVSPAMRRDTIVRGLFASASHAPNRVNVMVPALVFDYPLIYKKIVNASNWAAVVVARIRARAVTGAIGCEYRLQALKFFNRDLASGQP